MRVSLLSLSFRLFTRQFRWPLSVPEFQVLLLATAYTTPAAKQHNAARKDLWCVLQRTDFLSAMSPIIQVDFLDMHVVLEWGPSSKGASIKYVRKIFGIFYPLPSCTLFTQPISTIVRKNWENDQCMIGNIALLLQVVEEIFFLLDFGIIIPGEGIISNHMGRSVCTWLHGIIFTFHSITRYNLILFPT